MFNKVILIGNLTRDPELRYTPQGTSVCNFGIAVNRKYKQAEEVKEEVTFINIVVFGKQADTCGQYLNKGSAVLVEGRLQERRWETEEGQKRSKHEVVAQNVRFLSRKQGSVDNSSFGGGGETLRPDETTEIEPF
ncbi:MAG: single-stranded DNA-binding protein [Thermodesulfovibrionia bacterium]|nr:single-stranded DNA-binding protein [Thermodesulfovibrionia bacterium]